MPYEFSQRRAVLKKLAQSSLCLNTLGQRLLGGLTGLSAIPAQAATQSWPSKQIHFVVPFSAGGANDLIGRAGAEGAAKALGLEQPILIDNKPGGGTTLGANFVAKSLPDGHTFLISASGVITNSFIKKSMPYRDSDLVPVAMIALAPSIIIVPSSSPYMSLKDLVQKSQTPNGLNFSTAGTGSTPHFVAELLNLRHNANFKMVPFKSGSESLNAVIGAQVDATSEASIIVLPHLSSGRIRALATTWTQRITALPDLKTAIEQGYSELKIAHWAGVHAPKGTPESIMDAMAKAIDTSIKDSSISNRLREVGIEPVGGSRESFNQFIKSERAKLSMVVKESAMVED
jgi:tripartite-type tricarboxylate transporter receptor subunit TctC